MCILPIKKAGQLARFSQINLWERKDHSRKIDFKQGHKKKDRPADGCTIPDSANSSTRASVAAARLVQVRVI